VAGQDQRPGGQLEDQPAEHERERTQQGTAALGATNTLQTTAVTTRSPIASASFGARLS
jgi:hypothetical protein